MSAAMFHAMLGAGGVNPLAVRYRDNNIVYYRDSNTVLYRG